MSDVLSTDRQLHTPGPWHVGVGGNFHANRVWTNDMRPIANLCTMGTAPADLDPEAQGSACLIAAAPNLFAIANELHGTFDEQLYQELSRLEQEPLDEAEFCVNLTMKQIRSLNEAILKAEGKKP